MGNKITVRRGERTVEIDYETIMAATDSLSDGIYDAIRGLEIANRAMALTQKLLLGKLLENEGGE